jgi:predicted ABC-type ATPase
MPHIIVISGPNGAGKTTAAPALLKDALRVSAFVNADTIAEGLCAFQPETVAIQAGRMMLKRMRFLAEEKTNFAFETTLASRTFYPWITKLKKEGYIFHLTFLWLEGADLAVSRVMERVKMGGHIVPEQTIRRRYQSGLINFFDLYSPLADSWQLYDNSNKGQLRIVASKIRNDKIRISINNTWQKILENYNS